MKGTREGVMSAVFANEDLEIVDRAVRERRLVAFGDRLVCQRCGACLPAAAVGLLAVHGRGVCPVPDPLSEPPAK